MLTDFVITTMMMMMMVTMNLLKKFALASPPTLSRFYFAGSLRANPKSDVTSRPL